MKNQKIEIFFRKKKNGNMTCELKLPLKEKFIDISNMLATAQENLLSLSNYGVTEENMGSITIDEIYKIKEGKKIVVVDGQ